MPLTENHQPSGDAESSDAATTISGAAKEPHQALATPPAPVPPRSRLAAQVILLILGLIFAPLSIGLTLHGAQILELHVMKGSMWGSTSGLTYLALGLALFAALAILSGIKSTYGLSIVLLIMLYVTLYQSASADSQPIFVQHQVALFGWSAFTPALLGASLGAVYAMYVARRSGIQDVLRDNAALDKMPSSGIQLPPAPSSKRTALIITTVTSSVSAIIIFLAFAYEAAHIDFTNAAPPVFTVMTPTKTIIFVVIITLLSALMTGICYVSSFGSMLASGVFLMIPSIVISFIGVLSTGSPIKGGSYFAWFSALATPAAILGVFIFICAFATQFAYREGVHREMRDLERLKRASQRRAEKRDRQARLESTGGHTVKKVSPFTDDAAGERVNTSRNSDTDHNITDPDNRHLETDKADQADKTP